MSAEAVIQQDRRRALKREPAMSARDQFAATTMASLLPALWPQDAAERARNLRNMAALAYEVADALCVTRKSKRVADR